MACTGDVTGDGTAPIVGVVGPLRRVQRVNRNIREAPISVRTLESIVAGGVTERHTRRMSIARP